jgi:hypothetical protein
MMNYNLIRLRFWGILTLALVISMFVFTPLGVSLMLGAWALLSSPIGMLYFLITKNVPGFTKFCRRNALLFLISTACFLIFRVDEAGTRSNMREIITACEQYKVKNEHYPEELRVLVPEFMGSIPKAMRIGLDGEFNYTVLDGSHFLYYKIFLGGREVYCFETKKYGAKVEKEARR